VNFSQNSLKFPPLPADIRAVDDSVHADLVSAGQRGEPSLEKTSGTFNLRFFER